jgi:effector-binding domain-containing protein
MGERREGDKKRVKERNKETILSVIFDGSYDSSNETRRTF